MREPRNARINVYAADGSPIDHWPVASGLFASNAMVVDTAGEVYLKILLGPPQRNRPWPIGPAPESRGRAVGHDSRAAVHRRAGERPQRLHEATGLGCEDVERLAHTIQRRVLRHFVRRGLLDDYAAHDMLTWQAAGGFSLNASVRVEGHDRAGRERLLRYCARPPFALERLIIETAATAGDDGHGANAGVRRVIYRLPRATPDGRTILTLSPLEFLDAIARLIPPPRVHRQRYHGVLAPNARLRPAVTAWARQATQQAETGSDKPPTLESHAGELAAAPSPSAADPAKQLPSRPRSTRARLEPHSAAPASATSSLWARLIARIYQAFPLLCPTCGGELRILAFSAQPQPTHNILHHLGLPTRAPRTSPARAPPELAFDFDQTPVFDPTDPEPLPAFEFDQTSAG